MANPYVKQTWVDNNVANPTSAARMGVLEQGIFDAHYQPAVHVTHNANQAITTATLTALAFNTERFDQASNVADTMHDNVTNNSRLTCRYAGIYLVTANVQWAANATGARLCQIRSSVAATIVASVRHSAVAADPVDQIATTLLQMAVNDYVECCVYQNSGGNLNVSLLGNQSPEFSMVRVG